jgi:hypothetical protein
LLYGTGFANVRVPPMLPAVGVVGLVALLPCW